MEIVSLEKSQGRKSLVRQAAKERWENLPGPRFPQAARLQRTGPYIRAPLRSVALPKLLAFFFLPSFLLPVTNQFACPYLPLLGSLSEDRARA